MSDPSFGSGDMAAAVNDSGQLINDTAEKNVTEKVPSTPEGIAVAYGSLIIMALVPIFFGSFRSVRYHREQKVGRLLLTTYVASVGPDNEAIIVPVWLTLET